MSNFTIDKLREESVLLKRVAELVEKGEPRRAIVLLQEALKATTESEVILSSLINLCKQVGQFEHAKRYTQKLFNIQSKLLDSTQMDLPNEHDLDFLNTQLNEISEAEYSFEATTAKPVKPRKTLSLKGKKHFQSDEGNEKSKVFVKNKLKYLLQEQKGNVIERGSTVKKTEDDTHSKIEVGSQYNGLDAVKANSHKYSDDDVSESNSQPIKAINEEQAIDSQSSSAMSCVVRGGAYFDYL